MTSFRQKKNYARWKSGSTQGMNSFANDNYMGKYVKLKEKFLFTYLAVIVLQSLLWLAGSFSCGMQTLSCGMWYLVPSPGIELRPPELGGQSLSHWITREVPISKSLKKSFKSLYNDLKQKQ